MRRCGAMTVILEAGRPPDLQLIELHAHALYRHDARGHITAIQ
jgi:hypothetical protein